tara:strand:- start:10286 stop:10888 length:603 start_codon:yes stop_codon:yes gene_type:complete
MRPFNKILKSFCLLFSFYTFNAQNFKSVKINSVTQSRNNININYQLNSKWFIKNNVKLYTSKLGENNWQGPLEAISGNCGDRVKKGENTIVWNVMNEREEFKGMWRFGIENSITIKKNIKNLKLTFGLLSLASLGISSYFFNQSENYYNQYQTATTNAAKMRENSQEMMQLGIYSVAAFSLFFSQRTIFAKKIKKIKKHL